jgi:tetratricopeptide (TPR) repeat protein
MHHFLLPVILLSATGCSSPAARVPSVTDAADFAERGRGLVKCGQFALGTELLQIAAGMDPRSVSIQVELGDAYLEVGDLLSAETAYRTAAFIDESSPFPEVREPRHHDSAREAIQQVAMKRLSLVLVLSGQWGEDRLDETDPAAHLDSGWVAVNSPDSFGRTIAKLSEICESAERSLDPLGGWDDGRREASRRRQSEPLPGSMAAADRDFLAGKHGDAVGQYSRILEATTAARIEHEPFLLRHVVGQSLRKRGTASMAQGHWDLAHADFAAACRVRPCDPASLVDRGVASLALHHTDAALADFNSALGLDPDHFTARFCRARALWEQQRLEEALLDFTATLSRAVSSTSPPESLILTERAFLLHQMGRLAEAEADFRRACRNRGTAVLPEGARLNFACLLWDLDRYEESLAILRPMADSKSESLRKHAWLGLALCELRLGHEGDSLEWFRKALQAEPRFLTDFATLAREEGAWLSEPELEAVRALGRKAAR